MLTKHTALTLLVFLTMGYAQAQETPKSQEVPDIHPPHWSYDGATDPKHWSELEPAFSTCKLGHQQSPINITHAHKVKLPALDLQYSPSTAIVVNNGHTIQVNMDPAATLTIDDSVYHLKQFHFHTPSEEHIDGAAFPLEAHFVHQNEAGQLAVVAVFFKEGKANPVLSKIFAKMPAKEGEQVNLEALFNPAELFPTNRAYYKYDGSLTTPPCSEHVLWRVMQHPVTISKAQVDTFRKLYQHNARPIQPLNGRSLEASY